MTQSRRRPRAWIVTRVVAGAAALGGCGGGSDGDGADPPDVTAAVLAAESIESRTIDARGNLGLALTNTGDAPVDIDSVELTAPPFPASSVTPRGPLDPGQTVTYQLPRGEPVCAGLTTYPDGNAPDDAYTAAVTVDDTTVTLPVGRAEALRRIGDRACAAEAVLAVADVTFGPPAPADPPDEATGSGTTVRTTVVLTRRSGAAGTVAVTGLRGTPQFALTADGDPPLATLGADDTASVPVTVSALRCDAHVLAEGKKNYRFGVFLSLDGGPDTLVEIPAPEPLHAALIDLCM